MQNVDTLVAQGRFRAAHDQLRALLGKNDLPAPERVEAQVLMAHVLRRASPMLDDALRNALDAAAGASRLGDLGRFLGGRARIEAARIYARKRCRGLADLALQDAATALSADPRVDLARAYVLLDFDERTAAVEAFQAALAKGSAEGRIGLAWVALLAGDFDVAEGHLAEVKEPDLWARRVRARLEVSRQRWRELASAYDDLLAASPEADSANGDRYERASAFYQAGRQADAVTAWKALAAADATGHFGRLAARNVRLLERPEAASATRRRLPQFPSVTQLRNHCGPASCELYLRFFGLTAGQVDIAREIKFPDGGTPVYRMRRFLEKAGFVARRVEADLPRLKRLIDAGIPVIMEEDYSDSRHVAVAIGYDDAREVLEVQDPMSHDIRETHYEDLPKIRNMSNHGALVAVPAAEAARLDEAGAVEALYITKTDEAWAAWDDEKFADGERLADEALALHREYELAWLWRFRRARMVAGEAGAPPEKKVALHRLISEIQSIWPDDEWPQQLAGEVLYFDGRHREALTAFEHARDRDQGDAHNWSWIADCLISLGRDRDAYDALVNALHRHPAHPRAHENLAWLAMNRNDVAFSWQLNEIARELGAKNPFNHEIHGKLLLRRGDDDGAIAAFDRALTLDPGRLGVVYEKVRAMGRVGLVDDAAAELERRLNELPEEAGLRIELADLLYNHGRAERAIGASQALIEKHPQSDTGHAILGAALAASGKLDEGLAAMRTALERRPIYAWVWNEMSRHLLAAGRHLEAIQAAAAAFGLSGDPKHEHQLGVALVKAGHGAKAGGYLKSAGVNGRLGEKELAEIGELLVEVEHGGAAHNFFEDVSRKRSGELPVLRAHARTLLEVLWAPGAAEGVLEAIAAIAPDDPYALTSRAQLAFDQSVEAEADGERLCRRAIEKDPTLEYPRRVLATFLNDRGRFAEALEVLAPASSRFTTAEQRIIAHCGLGNLDDAEATAAAFEKERGEVGALRLRYKIARRRWDWEAALVIAEKISRANQERDDDGKLDQWEREKFECLARLGQDDRARTFGLSQATDAPSLGRLAYEASGADRLPLAGELAERALRLDPDESSALHVMARLAEQRGETAVAIATWERLGQVEPGWHLWHEQIARVCLGTGELVRARAEADAAVTDGHTCPWAFAVRAQARLLAGDRAGAAADLERCWMLASPASREHEQHELWAVRAALAGDAAAAEALFARSLAADAVISSLDRARIGRIREAALASGAVASG